jgi:hypothetical protein
LGARSITKYIEDLLDRNFARSVNNWENQAAKAHLSVGTGKSAFLTFDEPYDAVEIDAYHIDAHLTVPFSNEKPINIEGNSYGCREASWWGAVTEALVVAKCPK